MRDDHLDHFHKLSCNVQAPSNLKDTEEAFLLDLARTNQDAHLRALLPKFLTLELRPQKDIIKAAATAGAVAALKVLVMSKMDKQNREYDILNPEREETMTHPGLGLLRGRPSRLNGFFGWEDVLGSLLEAKAMDGFKDLLPLLWKYTEMVSLLIHVLSLESQEAYDLWKPYGILDFKSGFTCKCSTNGIDHKRKFTKRPATQNGAGFTNAFLIRTSAGNPFREMLLLDLWEATQVFKNRPDWLGKGGTVLTVANRACLATSLYLVSMSPNVAWYCTVIQPAQALSSAGRSQGQISKMPPNPSYNAAGRHTFLTNMHASIMDTPEAKRRLSETAHDSISSPHAIKRPSTTLSKHEAAFDPFAACHFSSVTAPWDSLTDEPLAAPLGEPWFHIHMHPSLGTSMSEQSYGLYNPNQSLDFDQLEQRPGYLHDMSQMNNAATSLLMSTALNNSEHTQLLEDDETALQPFSLDWLSCGKTSPNDGINIIQTPYTDDTIGISKTPDTVSALEKSPQVVKDACFGVIVAQVTISTHIPEAKTAIDIDLQQCGNFSKMYSKETKEYIGILTLPGLETVARWPTVELKGSITQSAMDTKSTNPKGTATAKVLQEAKKLKSFDCRILVHGSRAEGKDVGLALSDASLYLQHPYAEEVDDSLTYWNPHILVRPNGSMPKLEDLSLSPSSTNLEQSLGDVDRCRILRIFDSANDHTAMPVSYELSPRLRSKPMRHQLQAIAMMMERESKIMHNAKFPSLWIPEDSPPRASLPPYPYRYYQHEPSPHLWGNPSRSTVSWKQQIHRHIDSTRFSYFLYHGNDKRKAAKGFKGHDVVLTTYETLRSDIKSKGPLASTAWLRVVLDEAHHIRNRGSQVFEAACKLRARYRWCLTGTPIQNSVDDYGALLAFIRVPSLATKVQFDKHVSTPIRKQTHDAFNRLRDLVNATCLRRTKATVGLDFELPSKSEMIESIVLDKEDQELYDLFQKRAEDVASQRKINGSEGSEYQGRNILSLITILRRICDHGKRMVPSRAFDLLDPSSNDKDRNDIPLSNLIDTSCSQCGEDLDDSTITPASSSHDCEQSVAICSSCRIDLRENNQEAQAMELDDGTAQPVPNPTVLLDVVSPSAKVKALLSNMHKHPGKSVIFTSWTAMIDLVEIAFRMNKIQFQRLDGQMSPKARERAISEFSVDPQCLAILCNIGSAAEGIDLTAASQVHILEPHWNPMAEAQAVDRVHRIGQTKEVTVIRYLVTDTVEMATNIPLKYVKWVQEEKLRIISQSLNCIETAEEHEKRKAEVLRKYLSSEKL
ncbi:hypothetical protein PG984_013454 [Apiospora sp. TS-2023a]